MPVRAASPTHPLAESPKAGTLHASLACPPAPATPPSFPQSSLKEHPGLAGKEETRECGFGEDPRDYQGDGWPRRWAQWVGTPGSPAALHSGWTSLSAPWILKPRAAQGAAPLLSSPFFPRQAGTLNDQAHQPEQFHSPSSAYTPDMGRDTYTHRHNLGAGPLPKRREVEPSEQMENSWRYLPKSLQLPIRRSYLVWGSVTGSFSGSSTLIGKTARSLLFK